MSEWISVYDKAPEDGQKVIYYFRPCGTFIGQYTRLPDDDYGTHCFHGSSGFLTDEDVYWMPLPEPPKEFNK